MKNIIWQKPDGGLTVTSIADIALDSAKYATQLKESDSIPGDWVVKAVDTVFVAPPLPWPPIKAQELDKIRETRERTINRLTGIAARAARAGDTATATACDVATVALLGMTTTPDVLAAADLPALKLAIQTAYAGAVAMLPASARNAFNGANV